MARRDDFPIRVLGTTLVVAVLLAAAGVALVVVARQRAPRQALIGHSVSTTTAALELAMPPVTGAVLRGPPRPPPAAVPAPVGATTAAAGEAPAPVGATTAAAGEGPATGAAAGLAPGASADSGQAQAAAPAPSGQGAAAAAAPSGQVSAAAAARGARRAGQSRPQARAVVSAQLARRPRPVQGTASVRAAVSPAYRGQGRARMDTTGPAGIRLLGVPVTTARSTRAPPDTGG